MHTNPWLAPWATNLSPLPGLAPEGQITNNGAGDTTPARDVSTAVPEQPPWRSHHRAGATTVAEQIQAAGAATGL
ncbi:MAG: hypothetical protein IH991_20630 [Planctomycetes bacterium]|nr:hypothetical protein [Planctomycetota bacterium]